MTRNPHFEAIEEAANRHANDEDGESPASSERTGKPEKAGDVAERLTERVRPSERRHEAEG